MVSTRGILFMKRNQHSPEVQQFISHAARILVEKTLKDMAALTNDPEPLLSGEF
jgi:hypothetical protein